MALISEKRARSLLHALFRVVNKKLIVINIDYMGLGNRLRLLAIYDVNYGLDDTTLFWNVEGWVNSTLSDIIHIEDVRNFKERAITRTRFMVPIITHPGKPAFRERGFWRLDAGPELSGEYLITRQGLTFPAIDFLYQRTPQPYLDRYKTFFARLKPSEAVARRVASVDMSNDVVCVQVRNTVDQNDHANVPELTSYLQRMQEFPDTTRFFISTLDASISDVFRHRFGHRVLELPDKNYRSMIDATADLFLLGRGDHLILCEKSSFGDVAWWLAGGRQSVTEVPAEIFG